MGKYHDWEDCSICHYKRHNSPIKRVRFSIAHSDRELVCDFCLNVIKKEAHKREEEICQTCYNKSLKNETVISPYPIIPLIDSYYHT
jgi:hypothetical protein